MKKILFGLIVVLMLCSIACNVYAASSIMDKAKEWIEQGKDADPRKTLFVFNTGGYDDFEELAGLLTGLGIWIILIVGMIMGIRFMISSPEKKSDLKKALIVYFIGTGIILGAIIIWRVVFNLLIPIII